MDRRSPFPIIAVCWLVAGAAACAQPENSCQQMWKNADANNDGVLTGPEEDRYIAYYRVRGNVAPIDGRITEAQVVNACTYNILKVNSGDKGGRFTP